VRLRKIKRISFEAFLSLKGLFENFWHSTPKSHIDSKDSSRRAPTINDRKSDTHIACHEKSNGVRYADYEPSQIHNTRTSSFWQWRRVAEWYRYIIDPIENKNGHMLT
jgi:hypothetical protein